MRRRLFILCVPAFLVGCASDRKFPKLPYVEEEEDLGFGFYRRTLAEAVDTWWESIGHFEYLFYKRRKIASLVDCSVSPDGKHVIYQGGDENLLHLLRRSDLRDTPLTTSFPGLVKSFAWNEMRQTVEVTFRDGRKQSFSFN